MKNTVVFLAFVAFVTISLSFNLQEDPWKVPEKYVNMKNPVKADAASIKAGKELYHEHCFSCHLNGKGDGPKAASLNYSPTDLTTAAFQKQTDGEIFYKIYYGHNDMPGFKKRIPDNDDAIENEFGVTRGPGDLINYIRTLNKPDKQTRTTGL